MVAFKPTIGAMLMALSLPWTTTGFILSMPPTRPSFLLTKALSLTTTRSSPKPALVPRPSRPLCPPLQLSGSHAVPHRSHPKDLGAIARYFSATFLQWGLIMAFFALLQNSLIAAFASDRIRNVFVSLLFAFLSLRSRVFSPLDARRPSTMEEEKMRLERKRPGWMPPPIAFPIIWTAIAILRTVSSVLIFTTQGETLLVKPLALIALHLSVDTWNCINNVEKRLGTAVLGVFAVWLSVVATVYSYYKTLPIAGLILLPSAIWITAANALVFNIWWINGKEPMLPRVRQAAPTITPPPPPAEPAPSS